MGRGCTRPVVCRCWPGLGAGSPGIQEARAICSAVQRSRCPSKESIPESSAAHRCRAPSSSCRTARELTTVASVTETHSPQRGCVGLPLSAYLAVLGTSFCSSLFRTGQPMYDCLPSVRSHGACWPAHIVWWALTDVATQGTLSTAQRAPGEALLLR